MSENLCNFGRFNHAVDFFIHHNYRRQAARPDAIDRFKGETAVLGRIARFNPELSFEPLGNPLSPRDMAGRAEANPDLVLSPGYERKGLVERYDMINLGLRDTQHFGKPADRLARYIAEPGLRPLRSSPGERTR